MSFYTDPQRKIQEQFECLDLADAVEEDIVDDVLLDHHKDFIASRDFFFLSSVNSAGEPTVSHKGGKRGFVKVVDDETLVFPIYDGNGMFLSAGNIADTGKIGLLFIDFETPNRLRIQATATLHSDGPWLDEYRGAIMVVSAHIDKVFINCARYIHKHTRVSTSRYVPDENGEQPLPAWKRLEHLQHALPPQDRGRADEEGGTITFEQYVEKLAAGES
jgi:uncharacterized protein